MLHLFSFARKNHKKEVNHPSDVQVFLPQKKCITGVFVVGSELRIHPKSLQSSNILPPIQGKTSFFGLSSGRFSAAVKPPPPPALAQPHSDWHCSFYRVAQDQLLAQDLVLTKCPKLLTLVRK